MCGGNHLIGVGNKKNRTLFGHCGAIQFFSG